MPRSARNDAEESGDIEAKIQKVEDIRAIMGLGVVMTPAFAVDGVVAGERHRGETFVEIPC